jgi:hypothetical protein
MHQNLAKTFSRTFTKGYLFHEDPRDISNIQRSNNFGYQIGTITGFNKGYYEITLCDELNQNDIIRIAHNDEDVILSLVKMYNRNGQLINSANKTVYVRAKEKLHLVNSRMRTLFGKEQSNPASRFIAEINQELLEKSFKEIEQKEKINKEEIFHKENVDYRVGDFVYHDVFGQGKIIELSGSIATIAFKHPYGIKKLMKNHKSIKKI